MDRRVTATVVAVVILAVTVVVLGVANPVRTARVGTDRLGPDSGQSVDEYLEFAQSTLTDDDPSERWALMSVRSSLTTAQVAAVVGSVRVSQVFAHVTLDRVQTPVVVVQVSAHPVALRHAVTNAAAQVVSATGERAAAVASVTRLRLSDDCACVAAVLVRATSADLRALSTNPEVRGVEALPADAIYGAFSVNPLLPETVDTRAVQPDDGAVPNR